LKSLFENLFVFSKKLHNLVAIFLNINNKFDEFIFIFSSLMNPDSLKWLRL